ncbi:MAG: hypothetical protein IPI49_00290 [Myxococcales bacterium]|nr:hypothetical protein [Myxococcales bacterium]
MPKNYTPGALLLSSRTETRAYSLRLRLAALVATSVAGLAGQGCTTSSGSSAKPSIAILDETTIRRGDLVAHVVHAEKGGRTALVAHVFSKFGTSMYDVVYESGKNLDKIKYRHHANMEIKTLRARHDPTMSMPMFGDAALFMFSEVEQQINASVKYDAQGCDSAASSLSCGSGVGACCDVHDQCYAQHGCTAASWAGTILTVGLGALVSDCVACNTAVAACMVTSSPGDAACCSADECGDSHHCGDGSGAEEAGGRCEDDCEYFGNCEYDCEYFGNCEYDCEYFGDCSSECDYIDDCDDDSVET